MSTMTVEVDDTDAKERARLHILAGIYQTANRVISGAPVRVTVENSYHAAAAWTTGDVITFNSAQITGLDLLDIERMNGVNFHELSHVLFTPRQTSSLMIWMTSQRGVTHLHTAFNILEDQRIETMFTALYPSTAPWFSAAISRWVLAEGKATATGYIYVRGRKYLDGRLRGALRATFVNPELLPRVDAVIDEYRSLAFPSGVERAQELIMEFRDILRDLHEEAGSPHSNMLPEDVFGHGSREVEIMSKGRTKSNSEQSKAQNRVKDSEDEVEAADQMAEGDLGSDSDSDSDSDSTSGSDGDGAGDQSDSDGASQYGQGDDGEGGGESADSDEDSHSGSGRGAAAGLNNDNSDLVKEVAESVLVNIRGDQTVIADLKNFQRQIQASLGTDMLPNSKSTLMLPEPEFTASLGAVRKRLAKLLSKADPGWETREATGRINPMRWSQERDITTAFDSWDEGVNDAVDMEVVIMLDESGSMAGMIRDASNAMWVLKRALDRIDVPTTVIAFASESRVLYKRNEKAGPLVKFSHDASGTDPLDGLIQAAQLFSRTRKTRKILISLTDGAWFGSMKDGLNSDDYMKKFKREGVTTAVGFLIPDGYVMDDAERNYQLYGHHASIFKVITADTIVPFIDNIVTQNIKSAIRR